MAKKPAISNDKYESTGETKVEFGVTLHRIRAKVAIGSVAAGSVAAGSVGGWIESESNLQTFGDAWVSGNAQVFGNAQVYGNAQVFGNARVYGDAQVFGAICAATRSDGYTFIVAPTPHGPRIIAGCRYFSIDDARQHWEKTRGGTQLGDESLAIVDFLERMSAIRGFDKPIAERPSAGDSQ